MRTSAGARNEKARRPDAVSGFSVYGLAARIDSNLRRRIFGSCFALASRSRALVAVLA
jgi:hypothetical protein